MITYVNKANADKYSFLYSRASEDLRTHDATGKKVEYGDSNAVKQFDKVTLTAETYQPNRYYIADAEKGYKLCTDDVFKADVEYYQSDDITSLDEYFSYIVQLNEISRRYTILPLDEEVFTIDANTRTITVPTSFAKNGIGVQGDEVAEIVYFKINRFFDAIDLDTKDIYIQWRSAAVDEKGNPIEGVSVPWVKDVESEPGFIIFGWPLSSKITQKAGNVQFAVRFYEFNEDTDTLMYSLSTLTQTAVIKPALDFDLPAIILDKTKIDDASGMISDRFENTELNTGAVKAEVPVWTKDLVEHIDLAEDAQGFRTIPVDYDVQAISTDAGQISYIWKKYNLKTDAREDIVHVISMRKSEDTVREDGVLYYRQDGEAYVLYSGTLDPENDPSGEYPTGGVFEKFSTGTLDGVGRYFAIATNRVRQSTATAKSIECIVPYPQKPVIETDLPETGILLPDAYDLTLAPVATKDDAGKFTYQWYKKAPGEEGFVAIEGGTSATLIIDGTDEEDPKTGAVGDGYYYVDITNNLNKEADTITSKTCRVTHTACQPEVSVVGDLNFKLSDVTEENEYLEVSAEIPETSGENCQRVDGVDEIRYQWYRYFAGLNGNVEDDVLKADQGTYVRDVDRAMEGATSPTFQPSSDGYYFCEVTNVYNGTTASKISRFFRVITA